VLQVDLDRLRAGQGPHISHVDPAVAVHVDPQPPQRVDGHTMVRRPARIVRVVHKAAFAVDDLFGNLSDIRHKAPRSWTGESLPDYP
jgi:hypothetical protein